MSLSPSTGTFVIDSTFEVPVFLNTGGQSVNAVELSIKFPPDKLQLVSSSTGKSVIGIWPTLPKFNNQTGEIDLTGGIPNGIVASHGLISTLTFRAKSIGSAVVKIDHSKVLSNDGSGTEIAVTTNNSLYQIILPPPAGPVVVSDTHPDQNTWYQENNVSLSWGDEGGVDGFSYMLSDQAADVPDDISEGTSHSVVYKNAADGRHYFHIKGLRNGQWGGTTHFVVNIDKTPPAMFSVEIIPGAKTSRRQPVIQFATTDATSGIDHYEIKILPLQQSSGPPGQILFIEATSPFIPDSALDNGKYDVIVRAYDGAKNFSEVTQRLEIAPAILQNIGDKGIEIRSFTTISWPVIYSLAGLLLLILAIVAFLAKRHHDRVHHSLAANQIPAELQQQLSELQQYREKYGKALVVMLALAASLFAWSHPVLAADNQVLSPPNISTVNKNLANDELFYVGGFTGIPNSQVVLFLQNLSTGETQQITVDADKSGEWFYRHNAFLSVGNYELWGQTKVDGQLSPPSAQIQLNVEKEALQFGASKISLPTLYLLILFFLGFVLLLLLWYIYFHYRKIRHKNQLMAKQVVEIEASIRRGFAVLNRDIQSELATLQKSNRKSVDDRLKQEQLLRDLEEIEQYLTKEVWELEQSEET